MTEGSSSVRVVLSLIGVINGELPRHVAEDCLDPSVRIHMDSADHEGVGLWYRWIHLIRTRGKLARLRMIPEKIACDPQNPGLVLLAMRWSGISRAAGHPVTTADIYNLRYLVRDDRIVEIWTHKINYVEVFGSWIRRPVLYRLYLCWALLYFRYLALRGRSLLAD
jgi:hypothetical protein